MVHPNIAAVTQQGQSLWQDDISRGQLTSGALEQAIDEVGIRGLTSNPTIFEKAIRPADAYDEQIAALLAEGKMRLWRSSRRSRSKTFATPAMCFRPVYDESDGADGFVSIEVSPDAARDADSTREQVRRLWDEVDRPNLMVKIPGTKKAPRSSARCWPRGRNINITLLFSIDAYERVAERLHRGAGEALGERQTDRPDRLGRLLLRQPGRHPGRQAARREIADADDRARQESLEALKGKVAVANAKLAYETLPGDLRAVPAATPSRPRGAKPQRPLWASTGTKNPAYSDVLYVDSLIGPHTVNTMPGETLQAFSIMASSRGPSTTTSRRPIASWRIGSRRDRSRRGHAALEDEGIASFTVVRIAARGVEAKKAKVAEAVAVAAR